MAATKQDILEVVVLTVVFVGLRYTSVPGMTYVYDETGLPVLWVGIVAPLVLADALKGAHRVGAFLAFLLVVTFLSWQQLCAIEAIPRAVTRPGFEFEWLGTSARIGAAAVAWALADRFERVGIGRGGLSVACLYSALIAPALYSAAGATVADAGSLQVTVGVALSLAALSVSIGTLSLVSPSTWPCQLSARVQLLGPLDVIAWPLAFQLVVYHAGVGWAVAGGVGVGVAIVLLLSCIRVSTVQRPILLLAAFPLVGWSAGAATLGFVSHDGIARRLSPGPFAGDQELVVDLSCACASGDADAPRIVDRLRQIDVRADILSAHPNRVVLQLHAVNDGVAPMASVLPRGHLTFSPIDDQEQPIPPVVISEADIAHAEVFWDQTGLPYVAIDFTPAGSRAFGAWTTANVNRRFAIVLDGRLLSAPVIREPILGGAARIQMGSDDADPEQSAKALAANLNSRAPLASDWSVSAITPARAR